jgi:hypothetical protein
MGEQSLAVGPTRGLAGGARKAGPKQPDGGGRPGAVGLVVLQCGLDDRLQQRMDEQPVADHSHQGEPTQGGNGVAKGKGVTCGGGQWFGHLSMMGRQQRLG